MTDTSQASKLTVSSHFSAYPSRVRCRRSPSSWLRLTALILALLFLVGLGGGLFPQAALATTTSSTSNPATELPYAVELSPDSPGHEQGYIHILGQAGASYKATLRVRNLASQPLTLRLQAIDASTGPYGGISYGLPEEKVQEVGSWVTLGATSLELAPEASTEVPVTVVVPAGAGPGDHVGGVAIWRPGDTAASSTTTVSEADNELRAIVKVQTRRVIAVHVEVAGAAEPHLRVTGVEAVGRPQGLYLDIAITNDGQLLTKGEGRIELPEENFTKDFSLGTFVPQTSIAYPILWTTKAETGKYLCHVVINYDEGQRTAEWNGEVVVNEGAENELAERLVVEPSPEQPSSESGLSPAVWVVIGAVGAIVVLAIGFSVFWLWRRRRHSEGATKL